MSKIDKDLAKKTVERLLEDRHFGSHLEAYFLSEIESDTFLELLEYFFITTKQNIEESLQDEDIYQNIVGIGAI